MRSNVKLAWIISGLALGTSLLFACPTPVPKLSPLLVPVNQSSTVTYVQNDDNYNAPATDGNTYAAINHYPIAITVDRPDGYTISGDGVSTRTINWNKPGVYNVTVSITAFWWNIEDEKYYSDVGTTTFQVTVVEVDISGFSLSPTWARGASCSLEAHQSTCLGSIIPSDASTITYSIQGDAHGATIDENSGVVTPGLTESGSITVRAMATDIPSCFAEAILLIKAHPVSIQSTTATPCDPPYGGDYTHTFSGTGGSLEGVEISESVRIVTNPFRDPWPGVRFPGGDNGWTLDESGKMTDSDNVSTDPGVVDVNDFLPDPPRTGLPARYITPQTLYWDCPLCHNWVPITRVPITRTLQEETTNFVFVTTVNGVAIPQPYIGPVLAP